MVGQRLSNRLTTETTDTYRKGNISGLKWVTLDGSVHHCRVQMKTPSAVIHLLRFFWLLLQIK